MVDTDNRTTELRLYSIFAGIFVTVLVLIPSASSKFIALGPLSIAGSTLVFPITFIFNDVLTEVYGFARSRRIIWTGMACQVFAALTYWVIGVWPAAPFWHDQAAYMTILGVAPRITAASLTAYFCGEFANSIVLSKMKYREGGKRGWSQGWRFVASTVIGEGIDSIVFMSIGFWGVLKTSDLLGTMATIYVLKVIYEIVALPFSTRFANWVKRMEGIDVIDDPEQTSYNPFGLSAPPRTDRSVPPLP